MITTPTQKNLLWLLYYCHHYYYHSSPLLLSCSGHHYCCGRRRSRQRNDFPQGAGPGLLGSRQRPIFIPVRPFRQMPVGFTLATTTMSACGDGGGHAQTATTSGHNKNNKNGWQCHQCTYQHSAPSGSRCAMCGALRDGVSKADMWDIDCKLRT